jgi:hypothetical protein
LFGIIALVAGASEPEPIYEKKNSSGLVFRRPETLLDRATEVIKKLMAEIHQMGPKRARII